MPSDSHRPLQWAGVAVVLGLTVALIGAFVHSGGEPVSPHSCVVEEVAGEPLELNATTKAYVEADALVADVHGNTLLVGTPNFLTRFSADGKVTGATRDSLLGVVIPLAGYARRVLFPIRTTEKIDGIRAFALPNGGWGIGFAEVAPRQGGANADSTVRLWFGTYDGDRWTAINEIRMPSTGAVDPRWASSLVAHGDTVSWAMTLHASKGRQIVVFSRRNGRWSHEMIPTFHSQVELGRSDSLGLVLLVVQPHSDPGARSDANSLVLWARDPDWRSIRRLVHGSTDGRVYEPKFSPSAEGGVLTWESAAGSQTTRGVDLRAIVGGWENGQSRSMVLDSALTGMQTHSDMLTIGMGARLWVSVRRASRLEQPELRFLSDVEGSPSVLAEFASPYAGFIAAASPRPGQVLITGLQYIPNRYLVSLVLRASVVCNADPTPRATEGAYHSTTR